jgi:hypothetical protein
LNQANPSQAAASNTGAFLGSLLGGGRKQETDQDDSEHDPNSFRTIPLPPTITTCGQNALGQITCSSSTIELFLGWDNSKPCEASVAKLKSPEDCKSFAKNAQRFGGS